MAAASACPLASVQRNWPIVYDKLTKYGLATPEVCVGAIGTIAKETGHTFEPVPEAYYVASQSAREAWYKNTAAHAPYSGGWWYYGRGFVQTTHDYNYKRVQDVTGIQCVQNPDLLLEPANAAEALCVYFRDHDMVSKCTNRDWSSVRRAVYGGTDLDGIQVLQRVANTLLG